MPATTRPEISETRTSGSPRKWRTQPPVHGIEPGPEREQEHGDGGLGAGLRPPHEGARGSRCGRRGRRPARAGRRTAPPDRRSRASAARRRTSPGTAAGTRGWWSIGGAAHAAPARRIATDACLTAGRPKRLIVARSGRRAPLGFGEREARAEERRGPWAYLRSSRLRVPQPRQVQVAGSAAMYSCPRVKRTCRWPERITPSRRPQEQRHWSGIARPLRWRQARGRAVVMRVIVGPCRLVRTADKTARFVRSSPAPSSDARQMRAPDHAGSTTSRHPPRASDLLDVDPVDLRPSLRREGVLRTPGTGPGHEFACPHTRALRAGERRPASRRCRSGSPSAAAGPCRGR